MTGLIKYDAACRALAEAVAVDEVQEILSQADAWRAYAHQAKNRDLEIGAARVRFRAERRLGELILAQKETVGLSKGGRPRGDKTRSDAEQVSAVPTLAEAGIDRKLSSRAQRMAAIEPEKFENLLELHRAEVLEENNKVSVDLLRTSAEADGRDKRRQLAQALSDTSAELPTGRLFPCAYIDPPWHRKQGVTGRSYENHYPTMTWDEIIALCERVAKILQPDNWVFLWMPRAHLLALHPIEMEFADDDGRVITRKVKMPLSWAVARALGCDNYSTCFVWTKTDEEHPSDQGGGVLVFDQDEILLMFKRGRGLPKPATDEKFKSNHRERKREHSRKPDHYREMIRTMTGGMPVLELFARVDAEHPLPPDWEAWGNQAKVEVLVDAPAALAISEFPPPEKSGGASLVGAEPMAHPDLFAPVEPAAVEVGCGQAPAINSQPLDEFEIMKAISRVDFPDRENVLPPLVQDFIDRGLAFHFGNRKDWGLTVPGWKRFHALDAERKAVAEREQQGAAADIPALQDAARHSDSGIVEQPDVASVDAASAMPLVVRSGLYSDGVEIVDGVLQCRLPLCNDEMDMQLALTAIARGQRVEGTIVRHLIGLNLAGATTTGLVITDEGRAWLERLVDVPVPVSDLPLFMAAGE